MRFRAWGATLTAAALVITGCSIGAQDDGRQSVVIASTNFSETNLLAQMYRQVLEANGVNATIRELTTREVIIPALESGSVQATPEYLGSLTEFINRQVNGPDAPQVATGDPTATFAQAQPLAAAEGIVMLEPSEAQNQNAFAVKEDLARANNLTTVSDLAAYSQNNPIDLGGPPECPQRPFCQPGLEEVYGVNIGSFSPLDAGGPLTVQAMNQGRINVALVFSSSGSITSNNLVVLKDDRQLQTAENITPALNSTAATPTVVAALDALSAALTTEDLQRMNQEVEVQRANPRRVAEEFLRSKDLIE